MRLLKYNNDGGFTTTEFLERNIPKYAILSHRWGDEEVTFKDLLEGTCKSMLGYGKIQFCGEQARRDGLQYFWVDTCCIDKSNSVELQEAINSMFRWYRRATKCYVYLPDVSLPHPNSAGGSNVAWELAFRSSIWFTRGWTLQELIAPASVDFFSKEGKLLGNKRSLERHIRDTTGIPARALRGSPLSGFSVTERMSWAANRVTTKYEDRVYSLCGIFSVFIPIMYGEGEEHARHRLQEAIDKKSNGVPPVLERKLTGRRDVGQENTQRFETRRHLTGFGNSDTFRGGSRIRCYRCDNRHLLNNCYANKDTVSKARDRRMKSNRCVNCGSGEHWGVDCDWEDLRKFE